MKKKKTKQPREIFFCFNEETRHLNMFLLGKGTPNKLVMSVFKKIQKELPVENFDEFGTFELKETVTKQSLKETLKKLFPNNFFRAIWSRRKKNLGFENTQPYVLRF